MLLNYHDVKSLLWILKYFTISFACWNNHDKTDSHIRFLYICLLCYYSFACACITHNSIHNRTFVNNVIEKVYLLILSISYGHPSLSLIPGHNIGHHKKTETRQDAMRTSKMRYKWNFLNLFLFHPTVAVSVFKVDVRYLSLQRLMGKTYYTEICMQWVFLVVIQMILIYLNWKKFVLYVYIPHLFAQYWIVTMNILQHTGCEKETIQSTPNSRNYNTARNFTGYTINFLTFNNGYHTIHHMFPTMHWSRLSEEHNIRIKPYIHPNLIQTNIIIYIFKSFIYPGIQVDYLGNKVVFDISEKDDIDLDWTLEHASENIQFSDYDVDISGPAILKQMSNFSLPKNKIDQKVKTFRGKQIFKRFLRKVTKSRQHLSITDKK